MLLLGLALDSVVDAILFAPAIEAGNPFEQVFSFHDTEEETLHRCALVAQRRHWFADGSTSDSVAARHYYSSFFGKAREELLENGLSPAAFKTFRHCVVDITSKVLVFAQQLGFNTSSLRDLKRKGLSTGFCQDGMRPWPTTSHLTLFHGIPQTCIPHIVAAPDVDAQVTFATVVDHLCADLRYR
jgi:hypothetical protein